MKNQFILCFCVLLSFSACQSNAAPPPEAVAPVPNENHLWWHEQEQYAFICLSINTFTNEEWGYGDESPSIFDPAEFDAEQWVTTIKAAGLKGLILTCKHHDGFCLWPSRYTEHSIKNSPFRDGKGDIVKEVSDACRKHGLFFGIYLSPWDRNHAQYASPEYITYFRNQLTELLSNYGEVSEVWFDGANGGDGYYGGARETRKIDNRTYYDWPNTGTIVRGLASKAVIFGGGRGGSDIRWCGNEEGFAGETNWCTGQENGAYWIPSEVDVSIRPGWFYHEAEDEKVRTPENLLKIYLESVGRGAGLLLNLPPDKRGLIHENDVKALLEWKKILDATFTNNLAARAKASASTYRGKSKQYAATNVTDGSKETYWATDDDVKTGSLEINLGKTQKVNYISIQEYIKSGQRVKSFEVDVWKDNAWVNAANGTTIGYKRILPLNAAETSKIRINITDAKACPLISNVEIY